MNLHPTSYLELLFELKNTKMLELLIILLFLHHESCILEVNSMKAFSVQGIVRPPMG